MRAYPKETLQKLHSWASRKSPSKNGPKKGGHLLKNGPSENEVKSINEIVLLGKGVAAAATVFGCRKHSPLTTTLCVCWIWLGIIFKNLA